MISTVEENQLRPMPVKNGQLWLFGYGSLIFKADFEYISRQPARIQGWSRRFWQGSHDHRGTPDSPGRVVTLIEDPCAVCLGMAYLVSEQVLRHLDFREKNGYLRFSTEMIFTDGNKDEALVYIATEDNAAFLGEAEHHAMAAQIASATGPSGRNSEYLINLAKALRQLGAQDSHVFDLENRVLSLIEKPGKYIGDN